MTLTHYLIVAKRWVWMVVLALVICGGASFLIAKITRPVYQASATLILSVNDSTNASVQAVPTYAQLVTGPAVLNPVLAQHPGLTFEQLSAMITVKPVPNTQLIEIDVEANDPRLAAQLANEVSQSFARFANARLPGTVQGLSAKVPTDPVRPKVLTDTGIGALVGLGLALALIVLFEWLDDRLRSSGEAQELLGMEILAIIPWLSRRQRMRRAEETPALAEGYRMLSASLDVLQKVKPFKLVMVTSALAGEGKSSISTNLASFLAMAGKRILLVDADLRSPVLDQYFELEGQPELAGMFTETWTGIDEYLDGQLTDIPNLCVLTAEVLPSNFMDLFLSPQVNQFLERFQKAPFDYIIFDTPPLLPTADAQILASYMQAVVLVVDPSKTPRKLLLRVKHLLNRTHARVLGVVINKSRWPEHGEIRQYLKERRHYRTATPAMTRPPETPSMNGLGDSDATVVLPRLQATKEDQL